MQNTSLNLVRIALFASALMSLLPAIVQTAHAGSAQAVQTLKDCNDCPEMVIIPAGSFDMGSNDGEANEKPVRRVEVPAFAMAKTEITQRQWRAIMGSNPSFFKNCDKCPVENVNWDDAQAFVRALSEKTGKTYRLPNEAEWEYAARAGSSTQYWWGNAASRSHMNYGTDRCCRGHAKGRDRWKEIAPVAQFPANPFGLHDMNGNVWEWTETCSHDSGAYVNISSPSSGADCGKRMLRGGSWDGSPRFTRTAYRVSYPSSDRVSVVGFRPVRVIEPKPVDRFTALD